MNRRGMTVLEILIALVILTGAVAPIFFVFRYSSVANLKSVKALQAANLAVEMMESFKFSGRTPFYVGIQGNQIFEDINEYSRLVQILDYERNKTSATKYTPYVRSEDFGEIVGFPEFKRELKIAFFPEEEFAPEDFNTPFKTDNLSVTNLFTMDETKRLAKRISIIVTVTYQDKTVPNEAEREKTFTAFTLVTNKEM